MTAHVDEHGRVTPHVLKPREFATTATARKGVPAWWVEERINAGRAGCGCACHQSPTAAPSVGGTPPPSLTAAAVGGGVHLRPVPEVAPSGAA